MLPDRRQRRAELRSDERDMASVYSVSQINAYIKHLFTSDYALANLWVRGEISNCKYHSSGHIYFTLKDRGAAMNCVLFASQRAQLRFRLQDGQQVEVHGQVSVYEKSGSYQLYARELRLSGQGELYERFLKLKQELAEMGMFDEGYKRPIPPYAMRIGIVTAPTGAAIQDICNIAKRRNPYVELILYPALVQGAHAKESIVRGIEALDRLRLDVLIVGRGGGSIEDLWAFNEECVAHAIFNANTPIISAVGHETDYTIADFVADLRAPTPSAAAELACFECDEFVKELSARGDALHGALLRKLRDARLAAKQREQRLNSRKPSRVLAELKERSGKDETRLLHALQRKLLAKRQRLLQDREAMRRGMEQKLLLGRHRLELLAGRLDALSPLKRLGGGYGYVTDESGRPLASVKELSEGQRLLTRLPDGRVLSRIERILPEGSNSGREA